MREPKILLFDCETSPSLAWVWRTGKQYVNFDQFKQGHKFDIICICYKWVGDQDVHSLDWGYNKQDSSDMVEKFGKIAASADLIIGHNSDKFDVKQINTQRLLHDLGPISWPTSEDTLKQLRKYFYLPSYKLDYVSQLLNGTGKDKMHFQDWVNIVEKTDRSSFDKMIKYCKNDVIMLERLWAKISIYCQAKAHVGLMKDGDKNSCDRCGSKEMRRDGFQYTSRGKRQRFECPNCGRKR